MLRSRLLRACAPATDDAEEEFNDYERECFGDEDGCDAWFYGEDPDAEDDDTELTPDQAAARIARLQKTIEEGKRAQAGRVTAEQMAAARERLRAGK